MAAQDADSTLVFLATDTAYSLDPAQNWDYGGGATILAHVYEGLFKFTGADQAELEPNLAAEIPTLENGGISEDGLTYTIKLKPGAKFHDGTPVNAEAVKFSYDRVKQLKLGVDFLFDQVEKIDAVDEETVQFTLKKPFSPFLYSIGSLWGNGIVSPTTVNANSTGEEDFGLAYLQSHDAGSGTVQAGQLRPRSEDGNDRARSRLVAGLGGRAPHRPRHHPVDRRTGNHPLDAGAGGCAHRHRSHPGRLGTRFPRWTASRPPNTPPACRA